MNGLIVDIDGRVESCEAPLFTQKPKATISILCFEPDFVELSSTIVNGNTVSTTTEFDIAYPLTAISAGFVFQLIVDRSLSAFTIYQRPLDNVVRSFDFSSALVAGDVLTISSVVGDKYVTLNHEGTLSSLMYGKSPQSQWMSLQRGINHFRVYATGAAVPFTIAYRPRYGGL